MIRRRAHRKHAIRRTGSYIGLDGAAIPVVGFGELRLATVARRGRDVREVERALHQAIELGITFIDVADEEATERMVGDAVRTLRARDRAIVACRVPVATPSIAEAIDRGLLRDRLPPRWIQHRVEASLRATRLDALPLAQLPIVPAWRESAAWPELVGTCARLVTAGKVLRWAGLVDQLADATDLAKEAWLCALSVVLGPCERASEALIDAAAATHMAILARRPLAGGALAGALGPGVKLAVGDDRRTLDDDPLEHLAVGAARLAVLVKRTPPAATSCKAARAVLESAPRRVHVECESLAELALRWTIDHRGVTCVLPRLHATAHVGEAIAAALANPLPADVIEAVTTILDN